MAPAGRPKKQDTAVNLWIVEQYYHGDDSTQSWGKPLKVCYSEEEAKECCEMEAKLYMEDLDTPYVDRDIERMITIRPSEHFYPSMDFWYYNSVLVNPDED